MSAERWQRLADDLTTAGIEVTIDEKPHMEALYGRVTHGCTRSVTIRRGGWLVEISDQWWRKNPDVWIGWAVHISDRDSIDITDRVCGGDSVSKKRSGVVSAVQSALRFVDTQQGAKA